MSIETIWNNIKHHEGEAFYTKTRIEYSYVVYADYLLINDLKSRKITKSTFDKAMRIVSPTPRKIELEGFRCHSYIWGIITDKRIKGI